MYILLHPDSALLNQWFGNVGLIKIVHFQLSTKGTFSEGLCLMNGKTIKSRTNTRLFCTFDFC